MNYKNWAPLISEISEKINFHPKLYFYYFFNSWFKRDKIMSLDSSVRERKLLLTLILATKTIDLGVNEFYLESKVPIRCFLTFKLQKKKKTNISSRRFFVWVNFRFFYFFRSYMSLSKFLGYVLGVLG